MSLQDFVNVIRARVRLTQNAKLDVTQIDTPGSNLNIIAYGIAASLAEEVDARQAKRMAAHLTATAEGQDLDDQLAERSWGKLTRKSASAASLSLFLSRSSPASGDGYLPEGTELLVDSQTFTLVHGISFADGQTGKQQSEWICSKLGLAGNVQSTSSNTRFKTPQDLFEALTISTTNALGELPPNGDYATGGAEREKDSEFRARAALWFAGLDQGAEQLTAGALSISGISTAVAVESVDDLGNPTGAVALYLGDANGRANDALLAKVRIKLREFRMEGQAVSLYGSVPSLQSIVLSFGILDGYASAEVQSSARAAVVSAVNKLKSGETLNRALIAAAVKSVPGVVLLDAAPYGCTTPVADVVASSAVTLFRTSSELVTFA